MPKKSFKDDNPALSFISANQMDSEPVQSSPVQDVLEGIIQTVTDMESKKEEPRSKRFSLAVQPFLYDDLSIAATMYRTNLNELCNSILIDYVNGKKNQIEKFRELSKQFI